MHITSKMPSATAAVFSEENVSISDLREGDWEEGCVDEFGWREREPGGEGLHGERRDISVPENLSAMRSVVVPRVTKHPRDEDAGGHT